MTIRNLSPQAMFMALAREHKPVYIAPDSESTKFYAAGLHVATEEQKAEIQAYEEPAQ